MSFIPLLSTGISHCMLVFSVTKILRTVQCIYARYYKTLAQICQLNLKKNTQQHLLIFDSMCLGSKVKIR